MATRKKGSTTRPMMQPTAMRLAQESAALPVAHSTVSGPSRDDAPVRSNDALLQKHRGAQELAEAFPSNANKRAEYGDASAVPPRGAARGARRPEVTASTLPRPQLVAEDRQGAPAAGPNPGNGPLTACAWIRAGQALTTNQGVPVADNQHSLKAGLRGPALLEDFILREKITHFDHERIPERIVHARGSGAHGYFECYKSLRTSRVRHCLPKPASGPRCSCVSQPWSASAAPRIPPATCAASP